MYKFISLCCSIALVFSLAACSKDKPQEQAKKSQTTQQQPDIGTATAPVTPVTGKVLETMDASGYTYLNVETDAGTKWIAINQTSIEVGEEVTFLDGMVMQDFYSKTLDRTFPEIVFSSGLVGAGDNLPQMPPPGSGAESFSQALTSESGQPADIVPNLTSGSQRAVVESTGVNIEKASGENSYTIGEIFSKAAELDGKTVVVKGKVVKVSPRIMGRNWIHLQDGTGNPEENTHDLVITTALEPEADWDIITMQGVVAANKDFGSGYTYAVMIEEATLKQ
ncbi:MAG: DNA-binding protein [Desulfobulbales bacterium]|nr:DNA-binding protein [Desulfobulbales bacterium]